jgi:hypothetical protein
MMTHQLYKDAVVKVAHIHNVEQLTSEGWSVVEIREEDRQEPGYSYNEEVPDPHGNYSGCKMQLRKEAPSRLTTHLVFILIKGKDTVVEESRKIAENYKQKAVDMLNKLEACEKELEKSKQEVERIKQSRGYEESARIAAENRARNLEQGKMKLEEHIAKLRQEIGAQRFREIIGEEKKPEAST